MINEAQSMISVRSRHASQKHDSAARDSKLSNKDLDNIAELQQEASKHTNDHNKTISSIEQTAQEGGSKSQETSMIDVHRRTKKSINDVSEDRDHVEEMANSAQAEKKSMSIDIQKLKDDFNQKGGNTPNSQAAESSMQDSPLKPKAPRQRSNKEGRSGLSRTNVDESQASPHSPASPRTTRRQRDREGKKVEGRAFEIGQPSLSQNQEFLSAQRANLEHVHRLDRRIDETLDRLADVFHKLDRIASDVKRLGD